MNQKKKFVFVIEVIIMLASAYIASCIAQWAMDLITPYCYYGIARTIEQNIKVVENAKSFVKFSNGEMILKNNMSIMYFIAKGFLFFLILGIFCIPSCRFVEKKMQTKLLNW